MSTNINKAVDELLTLRDRMLDLLEMRGLNGQLGELRMLVDKIQIGIVMNFGGDPTASVVERILRLEPLFLSIQDKADGLDGTTPDRDVIAGAAVRLLKAFMNLKTEFLLWKPQSVEDEAEESTTNVPINVATDAARRHIIEVTPPQELAPFQYAMTETGMSVLPLHSETGGDDTRYAAARRAHLLEVAANITESLAGTNCSPQLKHAFTSMATKLDEEGVILRLGLAARTAQEIFKAEEEFLMEPLAALLRNCLSELDRYLAQFDDWRLFEGSIVDISVIEVHEKAISENLADLSRDLKNIPTVDSEVVVSLDEASQWSLHQTKGRGVSVQAKIKTLTNLVSAALTALSKDVLDQGRKSIARAIVFGIHVSVLGVLSHLAGYSWLSDAIRLAKVLLRIG